ncbi:MAG: cbiO2 [Paenibacillus sp.]|jgi:energy-coupling factor transport system ATP-binding protein|nr:cbiO2 [Paenibacillus sp.]
MIIIENMTIGRPNSNESEPILTNISCLLKKGTVTLITGQTGSGKSTFLHALAGLIPLQAGSVMYDGQPLWSGKRHNEAVKFKTGILFQYPEKQLFAESIRKEFAYSLRPFRLSKQETESRISEAMDRMKLPERLLSQSFFTLSDGQKRKVATATVIAAKPEWLLLDEPTAGIDPLSIPQLLETLAAHKDQGGGIVLVSHDLDTFLPVADRVLVMDNGTIAADTIPGELCRNPCILLHARIGLPSAVEISNVMLGYGLPLAKTPLTPEQTADAIIRQMQEKSNTHAESPVTEKVPQAREIVQSMPVPEPRKKAVSLMTAAQQLHPIAKWMFYLLLSSGILIQDHWPGIGTAAIITCICMYLSGAAYRTLLKPVKPFLLFILLSALISGLGLSFDPDSMRLERIDFSFTAAARTTKQLSVFLLIMQLGILFAVTTTGAKLQRGLEQAFSFLERLRLPIAAFTFSASLSLRFIPMLFAEIDRVSLITRARGKSRVKQGSIRLRDAHVFMIPLILSMMKHAEDLAFALEARGYRVKTLTGSSNRKLPFHRRDLLVMAAGILLAVILVVVDWK